MGEEDAEKAMTTPSEFKGKGGLRATSFIYGLAALENMGFVANMMSLVLFFMFKLYFDGPTAANTFTNLMGTTFLLSVVGGFISDTYINRFHTSMIFGAIELVSLAMLTIQAHSNNLLPSSPCGKSSCIEGGKAVYFYTTMFLLALGAGGYRGAFPALGADQFDENDPEEAKSLASYFNRLLLSIVGGASIGVTVIVWVSTNHPLKNNWWKGFLIINIFTFLGFIVLALGKPYYRLKIPEYSPLVRIAQVITIAIRNRGEPHPESPSELFEINKKDLDSTTATISHTQQFRWLDKAALILNHNRETSEWEICTVTQVEEVKVLARMVPIIASTIIMNTCLAQLQTFSVQQGNRMNTHLGSFRVPPASIPIIPLLFMIILIPIYDAVFVPFARKLTRHPSGITPLQRVGVGLVLSALSMSVAALVEVKRRQASLNNPISLFWLSFQYGIFGVADMFTLVGLMEFFYKEAPAGMKSLSTSFTWISLSLGYFLSSVLVEVVREITERVRESKEPWMHGLDLDQNRLDLFYWLLAVLSVLNFFHYLCWAMWYKYKSIADDGEAPEAVAAGE